MLEIPPDRLFKADDLNVGQRSRYTEFVDEGEDGARRNASTAEANQSVQARVVPATNMMVLDEFQEFSFRKNRSCKIQGLRVGYFCMDRDSEGSTVVLNRIVSLKEDAGKGS